MKYYVDKGFKNNQGCLISYESTALYHTLDEAQKCFNFLVSQLELGEYVELQAQEDNDDDFQPIAFYLEIKED